MTFIFLSISKYLERNSFLYEDGIETSVNDVHQMNISSPINVIDEGIQTLVNAVHPSKQWSPISLTDDGISI